MNKILFLVDSDRTVRMFYQERLSLNGLEVTTSSDLDGLSEKIDLQRPDIILMDEKRWEIFRLYSALQYDLSYAAPGYYVAKGPNSNGLKVRVNVVPRGDGESVDLVLLKGKNGNGAKQHHPGEDLTISFHASTEWENTGWELARNHN